MKCEPKTIDELGKLHACDWLEDKGQFSRVTTDPEESAWYCTLCGSLNVDAHEDVCYDCGEDVGEFDDTCPTCSGSGEGKYDGSTCSRCHGRGVLPGETDYEALIDAEEYRREDWR